MNAKKEKGDKNVEEEKEKMLSSIKSNNCTARRKAHAILSKQVKS